MLPAHYFVRVMANTVREMTIKQAIRKKPIPSLLSFCLEQASLDLDM